MSCYISAPINSPSGAPEHQTGLLNPDAEACRDPHSQQGAATPGMEKRSVTLTNLKMFKVRVLLFFLDIKDELKFPMIRVTTLFIQTSGTI